MLFRMLSRLWVCMMFGMLLWLCVCCVVSGQENGLNSGGISPDALDSASGAALLTLALSQNFLSGVPTQACALVCSFSGSFVHALVCMRIGRALQCMLRARLLRV